MRAAGGRVWWAPEVKGRPPAGTTAWGEAAVGLVGCGSRRFGFVSLVSYGAGLWWGWRLVLWSPSVLCPTPRMRLTEADRSGGIKPDHSCCGPAPFGLTPPARPAWASPEYAAWDPEHNTLMVRRIHRTSWSAPLHQPP